MAPRNPEKLAKKQGYMDKLKNLIQTVPNALIVHADNVGSLQFQQIRIALRGRATVLMGKNSMIRTAMRQYEQETGKDLSELIKAVRGNIGFIFCESDINEIRKEITQHKVPAPARAGVVAQCDVFVPAGPTGLDPAQTNFFQALNIATKIVKGTIEIVSEVHLCKKGTKVQASEQVLLQKLNVMPFAYGLEVRQVYQNGSLFDAAVLDITDEILLQKFFNGVSNVAAFSREIGVPTEASLPHMIINAFRNTAALVADNDYTFPEVEQIKAFLKDPSAFAVAAAPVAAAAAAPAAAAKAPEPEEEEEEGGMDFDLFD